MLKDEFPRCFFFFPFLFGAQKKKSSYQISDSTFGFKKEKEV